MADLIQNYDFDPILKGNWCEQVEFVLPTDNAYLLTGAKISMEWRKKPGQIVAAKFSDGKGITILGDYNFKFDAQLINIPADTYQYDILIVFLRDGNAEPETLIGGKVQIIATNTEYHP